MSMNRNSTYHERRCKNTKVADVAACLPSPPVSQLLGGNDSVRFSLLLPAKQAPASEMNNRACRSWLRAVATALTIREGLRAASSSPQSSAGSASCHSSSRICWQDCGMVLLCRPHYGSSGSKCSGSCPPGEQPVVSKNLDVIALL